MTLSPKEQLSDGVLTLRRYRAEDAPDVYEAARESIREIYPWLPWCRPDYEIAETHAWIASTIAAWDQGHAYEFVFRTADGRHVGGGGINALHPDHPLANLGYWVRTSEAGKGWATRAARLLGDFAIRELGLQRVEIVAAVGNHASQRVAEKAGATREGILRHRLVIHGIPHDAVMYSFIPADFRNADPEDS